MTSNASEWPMPKPSPLTEPFWKAANEGRLVLQRCSDCGAFQWTPQVLCRHCLSENQVWTQVSGRGTLHSYTVIHRAPDPSATDVPYVIATVELEEGPLMLTRLVEADPATVAVGMPLTVAFTRGSEAINFYTFRPG